MNSELKEKMEQKKQLNRAKIICGKIKGIQIEDFYCLTDLRIRNIKLFLSGEGNHKYKKLEDLTIDQNLIKNIVIILKKLDIGTDVFLAIKNCSYWMCKAKIIDWSSVITSLWEIGDICFFDMISNMGVYIGIEEDKCIVEVVEK